jgi:hypothetical protein
MQNSGSKLSNLIKGGGGIDKNFLLGMSLAAVVVFALWWTPLLFPFRMMTTTVHELSHAITVILTGGTVYNFDVNGNGSGVVTFSGGFALLIFSAGYLGSTLFGGVMLLVAKSEKGRRNSLKFLAVGVVLVLIVAGILKAVNTGNPANVFIFTDLWALLIVAGLVAGLWFLALKAPDIIVSFVAYTLALLSCLYAFFDLMNVFTSTISPLGGFNDARGLENATKIPAFIWAVVWVIIAGFILFSFFSRAIRTGGNSNSGSKGAAKGTGTPLDKYNDLFNKF